MKSASSVFDIELMQTMYSDHNWATLPRHLLDLVLEKLESSIDYLQFGAVCAPWYSVAKDNQSKRINMSYKQNQVPMLLIPSEKQHTWKVYNAIENRFLEQELAVPYGKRLCSSGEWLIAVNRDFTVTLYKPFSTVDSTIHLPCLFPPEDVNPTIYLEYVEDCHNHVSKAIITADPLANPDDCVLVVLFGDDSELAFIRPTKDTRWTKIDTNIGLFSDILYHSKDQIYALNDRGAVVSCDISSPSNLKVKVVAFMPPSGFLFSTKRYLVKSCRGELLQVKRSINWVEGAKFKRITEGFIVYKLDVRNKRWVQTNDLGDDVSLFLGDNSSTCVLASNFVGCQSNSIYFTHDYDTVEFGPYGPCDLGVYDFKDSCFKLHYTIDSTTIPRMTARPPIWVVPSLNL